MQCDHEIRMCHDMLPPPELMERCADLAVAEDPLNMIPGLGQMLTTALILPLKIAFVTGKKWKNGRVLKVAFMGGTEAQKQHVRSVVPEIEKYCSLRFLFDASPAEAEIRVAFNPSQGAYSYIGTDALGIPKNQPTLNLGWIEAGTTLHEFLHASAAIHEHQHPQAGIPWNKEAVYRYYGGPPNNWDRATIDGNIFGKYSVSSTQFSNYDPNSVMHYAIAAQLLLDPSFAVGWNKALSAMDKQWLGEVYPKAQEPPPPPSSGHKVYLALTGATAAKIVSAAEANLTLSFQNDPGTVTVSLKPEGGTMNWLTKLLALWTALRAGDWLKVIEILSELGKAQAAGQLTDAEAVQVEKALAQAQKSMPCP